MERRASLLVGVLGFGLVVYFFLKTASQPTHPDLVHFKPPPTRPPRRVAQWPPPTPIVDAEVQRDADRQRAAMELLVDLAASQYVDRVQEQIKRADPWVIEDLYCALSAKAPRKEGSFRSLPPPREVVLAWTGTFRCTNEKYLANVTFPVNLVFKDGRWEIDAATQKILSEGGYLDVRIELTKLDLARPTSVFPGTSGF